MFKSKIRKWKPKECYCKLCKQYIYNVWYAMKKVKFLNYEKSINTYK